MIPSVPVLTEEIGEIVYPSRTYKIVFSPTRKNAVQAWSVLKLSANVEEPTDTDRLVGYVDDIGAVAQAVYLILSTERYKYIIYSWDYGVELVDLIGQPMPYVMSELPRRITEALTMDDRISDVVDFEFEVNRKQLHTTFTVVTNVGNISTEMEVEV